MISIVCFKWGNKYRAIYPNRLYNMCKTFIQIPFTFYCITDNSEDINPEIKIKNMDDYNLPITPYGTELFTGEKINAISDEKFGEKIILFDLDILILNDLTDYLTTKFKAISKPIFIYNEWADQESVIENYGNITCCINSSFILTNSTNFHTRFLKRSFFKDYNFTSFMFHSLDKCLFYRHMYDINFHDKDIIYAYFFGAKFPDDIEKEIYRPNYKICIFNNSHGKGTDLHDLEGWPKEYWKKFK